MQRVCVVILCDVWFVLISMTGFRRLVAALSCVWVIQIVKHIKSSRDVDTKSIMVVSML